jgi:hypothetical protein
MFQEWIIHDNPEIYIYGEREGNVIPELLFTVNPNKSKKIDQPAVISYIHFCPYMLMLKAH